MNRWGLAAPIPALALGLAVATSHGISWTAYAPNLMAVPFGVAAALFVDRASPSARVRLIRIMPGCALALLAATLFCSGIEGVHRWLSVGPLRLNASSAFAPWLFSGLVSDTSRQRKLTTGMLVAGELIHYAQPDAAQASALALGALPLLIDPTVLPRKLGVSASLLLVILAGATWRRDDPLPPVEHVEQILTLIAAKGSVWASAASLATALLVAALLLPARNSWSLSPRPPLVGVTLAAYFCATFAATVFGNFPVPIFGAAAGPTLGWYSLMTVLFCAERTGNRCGSKLLR